MEIVLQRARQNHTDDSTHVRAFSPSMHCYPQANVKFFSCTVIFGDGILGWDLTTRSPFSVAEIADRTPYDALINDHLNNYSPMFAGT